MTVVIILLLFMYVYTVKGEHFARAPCAKKELYYGLVLAFYDIADRIIDYIIVKPIASPYLRWHRLLYSNRQLSFYLNLTLAKSLTIFFLALSLILDAYLFNAPLELYFSVIGLMSLLTALPILKVKRAYDEACHSIMKELPAFIQQMALLIKAGSNARQSVDTIYRYAKVGTGLHTLLAHVYFEHERGNDFFQSFSILNEFIHHKSIHHLSLLMGQVKRAGVHQFSNQLVELAELIMEERKTYVRMISEQLSTKLLAPMMISMVTILSLLIYPVMTQLN